MTVNSLKINFFPVKEQDFTIPIYRRLYKENENKKDFKFVVRKFSLSINDINENRANYWVTFDKNDTFEKREVSSSDNKYLTLYYLFLLIEKKVKNCQIKYQISEEFMNVIDIIIDEGELGKESICVIPTYQNEKYGILLDFHFLKKKDIPYSIDMQKKSLSLDQSGESNKNYYIDRYRKIDSFIKTQFKDIFMPLDEDGLIEFSNDMESIDAHRLETKKYVFGRGSQSNSQFQGVLNQGPYSKLNEEPMVGFVYINHEKALAYEMYHALRGERFTTFKGMERMFGVKIKKDTVIGYGVDDYNEKEIEKMVYTIMKISNGKKIVPIIIVPWDKTSADEMQNKMYYFIKYSFLWKECLVSKLKKIL
jgi:hypothetical protein